MSPPAGDIYCSSLRVRPSVRMLRYRYPSHISKNLRAKNLQKNSKNNTPTEVVQQKIKIQILPKILEVLPKKYFFDLCFVQARSR